MNVRRAVAALAGLTVALVGVPIAHSTTAVAVDDAPPPLTNLAHLDWLGDTVDPPEETEPLHTTYRLAEEPEIGVLWTYAEPNPDGDSRHAGPGPRRGRGSPPVGSTDQPGPPRLALGAGDPARPGGPHDLSAG